MKDRLSFETILLNNGMKLYTQYDPSVEFAHLNVVAPFGSEHVSADILPGSFHFMEHLVINRSREYPESNQFQDLVALRGGKTNARTFRDATEYSLSIASKYFDSFSKSLITHFFYPRFCEEDIIPEASIISNERKRFSKYYPGTTKTGYYASTQWKWLIITTPEQILGTDDDHLRYSVEYFENLHNYYRTHKSHFVAVGNFDVKKLIQTIEELSPPVLDLVSPPAVFTLPHWVNPTFRTYESDDVSRYEYYFDWIIADSQQKEPLHYEIQSVINDMLANYSLGKIFHWLRHEKGWVYDIIRTNSSYRNVMLGGLGIPLNSMEQVELVRSELTSRIYDTLSSRELLTKVSEKRQNSRVFYYQTLEKRLDMICADLRAHGRFYTEHDYMAIQESITAESLLEYFDKITQNYGEIVLVPKK